MADALPLLKATHVSCTCSVCLDVFKDPVAFHCGHVLCRSCAVRCITARPRCPLCNQSVPNARHLLPLPQLSLFCICVREVGLRVRQRHQQELHQQQERQGQQPLTSAEDRNCSTDRPTCDSSGGEMVGGKRPRPETSPRPRWATTADDLPEMFLRSTLSDTQRLLSESPERKSARQPTLSSEDTAHAVTTSTSLSLTAKDGEGDGLEACRGTPPPLRMREPTATSPLTPTRTALQAHFAAEAEELESTPRLDLASREREGVRDGAAARPGRGLPDPSHSRDPQQLQATAELPAWWRPWRCRRGVVRCLLLSPALRYAAAVAEKSVHSRHAEEVASRAQAAYQKAGKASCGTPADEHASLTPSEATRLHRSGTCVLCGLDVVQRTTVRHRLQRLLRSDFAQCDPAELTAQTEDGLALLLGPLWGIACDCAADAPTSSASSTSGDGLYEALEGREAERWLSRTSESSGNAGQRRSSHTLLRAVAHHNCLAWAGLLDLFTDTSTPEEAEVGEVAARRMSTAATALHMSVPMIDPFVLRASHASGRVAQWQLLAAAMWRARHSQDDREGEAGEETTSHRIDTLESNHGSALEAPPQVNTVAAREEPHCVLCDAPTPRMSPTPPSPFGVGLRACEGVERGESSCGRHFHYPCALLAGASACLVFSLEDSQNVVSDVDNPCVRVSGDARRPEGRPVEVWCGPCRERHEARLRARLS